MLKVTVRGLKNLQRDLKVESKRQKKALNTAIKVEGFRLMRLLKKEIRQGAPGGRKFAPLTYISRVVGGGGRLRANKPLRSLAVAVRYHIVKGNEFHLGWTGPRVSKSWQRIAKLQQEGFISPVSRDDRTYLAGRGSRMNKRSKARKYLFLKRSTRSFRTPARPIMEPFWDAHEKEAWPNIRRNFKRKMRGERI